MYLRRSILSLLGLLPIFGGAALAGLPAKSPDQALPAAPPPSRLGPLQIRVLRAPHVTTVEVEVEDTNFRVTPGCRMHLMRDGMSLGTQKLIYTAEFEGDNLARTTVRARFVLVDADGFILNLRAELLDSDNKVVTSGELSGVQIDPPEALGAGV